MAGLGALRRARYLAERAAAVSPSRLRQYASQAQKTTAKSQVRLIADMLWCSVRYEIAFQDYVDWDIHLLRRDERPTWMTHPKSNHLAQRYNDPSHRQRFANKLEFDREFDAFIGREWLDVRSASVDEVREFVERHGKVMAKVPDSLGGKGIGSRTAADIDDWSAFRDELVAGRQFLLEQFLVQHPVMASLNPSSVNTLRIITWFDGSEVSVLARVLKCGNGGDIDNFSSGGMYTMLDEAGVAHYAAFDGESDTFAVHPGSGTSIVGFEVPRFAEAVALADRLARIVPEIPYVGWDIAITPDGPVVIEGNYNTGVFQTKPSVSGVRTGLLPHYRDTIGF
ncbi:sugar-transfer associated ATP-grasp domain-containing protein [Agromyces seonyuensis]|uniref:Alpha-L-glutamate ligase-related protein ATP-grasp domain-containing protein n=1 Tax=Agromyces seonyuensis TaxID=2662446 RepID=A0A6I4P231_9MICO|nr:sugar-transfer associated ATP-grasp domain-containing protein [Agromyces seonyuensis]MWB99642.1 hypothetical protein [Agromyces seonyuensis]